MQFKSTIIEVDEDTRINVKLKTGQETEINAPGPHDLLSTQLEQLLQPIKNTTSEDIVLLEMYQVVFQAMRMRKLHKLQHRRV